MKPTEVLNILYKALRGSSWDRRIYAVAVDNDNEDEEIVLTTDDEKGRKQVWVISSKNIRLSGRVLETESKHDD